MAQGTFAAAPVGASALGSPLTVWQVGSSATIGTNTTFVGTIIALTSITLTTNATVAGRALARNGAVTMDANHVDTTVSLAAIPPRRGGDIRGLFPDVLRQVRPQ